jgi:hypothetical protein
MILLIGQSGSGLTFLTWSLAYLGITPMTRPGLYRPRPDGSFHNFEKEKHYRGALPSIQEFNSHDIVFWNPNHQKHLDAKPHNIHAMMVTVKKTETKRWLFNRNWRCVPNWTVKKLHQDLCKHHNKISVDKAFSFYWIRYIDYLDYNREYSGIKTLELDEIFHRLDYHIQELCDYFCLGFDQQKFDSWLEVYYEWKNINLSFGEEKPVIEIMSADPVMDDEVKIILRKLFTFNDT